MIKIRELCFSINNKSIINKLDLDLPENCINVILGPSGCGKTTLLRLISGLEKPSAGYIQFDNEEGKRRNNIGYVFQNLALWPHMTVRKHIRFMVKGAKEGSDVDSILKMVRLEGKKDSYPHELSGGQKQRLAIARSLATTPKLLLMDEPFSNLDILLRDELSTLLKTLVTERKITIVYVTHNIYEAIELADNIIFFSANGIPSVFDKTSLSQMSNYEIINLYREKQNA